MVNQINRLRMKYIRDIEQENRELKLRIEELESDIDKFSKEKEELLLQLASKTETE